MVQTLCLFEQYYFLFLYNCTFNVLSIKIYTTNFIYYKLLKPKLFTNNFVKL